MGISGAHEAKLQRICTQRLLQDKPFLQPIAGHGGRMDTRRLLTVLTAWEELFKATLFIGGAKAEGTL